MSGLARPRAQSPGLSPTRPSGPQYPRLPRGGAQRGVGTCPGPSSWSSSRSRPRRQDPGSLALVPAGAIGPKPWPGARCPLPQATLRGTRRQFATPQPAPLHHASRGTPELVVRGRTPRHASCSGGTPTPMRQRAAKTALCQ